MEWLTDFWKEKGYVYKEDGFLEKIISENDNEFKILDSKSDSLLRKSGILARKENNKFLMYDSNTGKEIELSEIEMIRFLAELTMKKNQSEELKDFEEESDNTQDEISGIEDQIENDREYTDSVIKANQEKIIDYLNMAQHDRLETLVHKINYYADEFDKLAGGNSFNAQAGDDGYSVLDPITRLADSVGLPTETSRVAMMFSLQEDYWMPNLTNEDAYFNGGRFTMHEQYLRKIGY